MHKYYPLENIFCKAIYFVLCARAKNALFLVVLRLQLDSKSREAGEQKTGIITEQASRYLSVKRFSSFKVSFTLFKWLPDFREKTTFLGEA